MKKMYKNNTLVIYIHGKGGIANESEHYKSLFSPCDVVVLDYKSNTPLGGKRRISQKN